MSQLPVIVGFGGISPAGRSSFHHGYRRLILDELNETSRAETLLDLATLMGLASFENGHYVDSEGKQRPMLELAETVVQQVKDNTLIRRINNDCFDVSSIVFNQPAKLSSAETVTFTLRKRQMPQQIPENWQIRELNANQVEVTFNGDLNTILPDTRPSQVKTAGQLPSGFKPGTLYQSRNHPRNLQMTVFGASDALNSSGIPWDTIADSVAPDQIGVYASNSIGQLDDLGFGGLVKFPSIGKRTTSKNMPLGYAQMPADFINAYILGSVGVTGGALGACATYLYNLRSAVNDIRSGRRKVVLVGGSDAPVTPEIIEGFRAMGALAEDKALLALDKLAELTDADYRKSCRPFGYNCGFTIAESCQFTLLMSDDLALQLGAQIHGAIPEVFVNADGHKKSISAPGIGNYITMGKAASLVKAMLGEESLRQRSFVQAHGTSTPQNRITESHVINETAKAFNIPAWRVAALKCFLGHSQGTAGGDQLNLSLGIWEHGIIPGITTTTEFADDIHASNLSLSNQHENVGVNGMDSVILNSKGFGGNNASAVMLSPQVTEAMLTKRHGKEAMARYQDKLTQTQLNASEYNQHSIKGLGKPIYRYDHNVLGGEDLQITDSAIHLPGYAQPVDLNINNPFADMND